MLKKLVHNKTFLLALIVLIAGFLRFYQVGNIPPSLTWDEVAWGYNSYALSIDGKDEFGKFLPYQYFLSFGDYKPPMYAYLGIVPVIIFGLTEFAVRFPSALFGTLTVLITYFLVRELLKLSETKSHFSEYVSLVSALFLALSPWHIMLSRGAFEANIATFLIVSGVWFFLLGVQRKPIFLLFSVICFIASIYTFNSARIVAPLLFLTLAIGYYKYLWENKKYSLIALVLGIVLLLPIVPFLLSPEAKLRYTEVNIFTDINIVKNANQEIANDNNAWWSKIIHNRRVAYGREFLIHYFDHFDPNFLFIKGDKNPKFSTQDVGQMYLWDLPFLIIGILFLLRKRGRNWWILPIWLLIGILPAAVARETPHALRIESTLPTWQIFTAYGFVSVMQYFKRFRIAIGAGLILALLVFIGYFLHGYYNHYSKQYSREWQYGYKQAIIYAKDNEDKYDGIYITNNLERAYMYTLFYTHYDPKKFRKEAKIREDNFGFVYVDNFGKYNFANDPYTIPSKNKRVLYISSVNQVPKNVKVLQTFRVLDGNELFKAYTKGK